MDNGYSIQRAPAPVADYKVKATAYKQKFSDLWTVLREAEKRTMIYETPDLIPQDELSSLVELAEKCMNIYEDMMTIIPGYKLAKDAKELSMINYRVTTLNELTTTEAARRLNRNDDMVQ